MNLLSYFVFFELFQFSVVKLEGNKKREPEEYESIKGIEREPPSFSVL